MDRRQLIAGNWKMNTSRAEAAALANDVVKGLERDELDVALFPPAIWLCDVAAIAADSPVSVGAQNCWTEPKGAFTGEISAPMVAEGATMGLVGPSERRQIFGERDALVRSKLDAALSAGLEPILCVGESLDIRQSGSAVAFVTAQINAALVGRSPEALARIVIAYEPIWAIGTGIAATSVDAQEMSAAIRVAIAAISPERASAMRILYGGSVGPANASGLLAQPDVDGALVGGASLKVADFLAIIAAAPR